MKLVELLARELSEWPEGVSRMCQSVVDSELYGEDDSGRCIFRVYPKKSSGNPLSENEYEYVTRAQWQAERDRQKGGEWKRHRGGKCPVPDQTQVEVKFRDGDIRQSHASDFFGWKHGELDDTRAEVMQYRVISQPQAEEVDVNDIYAVDNTDYGIPDVTFSEAKTDQIDGPIKWRDTVNELDAYIEEFTRERDSLIERLASEGFALIPPVVSVMSEFCGVDSDWRSWKKGDIIECVHSTCSGVYHVGGLYHVNGVCSTHADVQDDCGVGSSCHITDQDFESVQFIRRP